MREKNINAEFCVVGGGMSGLCAAIAAARRGVRTVLVQDRPMLGGNASSEIRMWICGAHGENNHETGLLEEILLENLYRQSSPCYSVWDSVLWEKARFQENLTLLLNCSINGLTMASEDRPEEQAEGRSEGPKDRIAAVRGWQMTTETWITVEADRFADCSGDGILAPLSGAEFRMGREGRNEHGESIAPETGDERTMGMSCLIQARETDRPQSFTPPSWAYSYEDDGALPERGHSLKGNQNFWWLEVGGMHHSIDDSEELRDELLKIAYGVWDHIKNHDEKGEHGAENWALDWIGFLPGKRESRRYLGDLILTQNDIEAEGKLFSDIVAYGGWTMDDHFPEGFYKKEAGTIFHPAPSPYGIPYRCLYSRNIENLFCAGRNISASHAALSSTRVMATCSLLGQAVGEAAALCGKYGTSPRGISEAHITELQDKLQDEDCFIPGRDRKVSDLTNRAELKVSNGEASDAEILRNGRDRDRPDQSNAWTGGPEDWIEYRLGAAEELRGLRLVFDSDLSRSTHNMVSYYRLDQEDFTLPGCLIRSFSVETERDGQWVELFREENNYQRLVRISLAEYGKISALRIRPLARWDGGEEMRIFSADLC